ncbi:MAG: FHA domain-containing protein [Pseudonocardia sp.]
MSTPYPGARVDAARAVVLPGPGAVVRLPGLLCLLCLPGGDDDPGTGALARFVEICTENSAAHPAAPGRPLARRFARWLGTLDPGPDFGTVAATESGIAIFLHGAVDAVVGGERYSARESGAWLDRLLPYPAGPIVLVAAGEPVPGSGRRGVFDLRGGVVPAGAVLLVPRSGTLPSVLATPAIAVSVSAVSVSQGAEPDPVATPPSPLPALAEPALPEPASAGHPVVAVTPSGACTPAAARRVSAILGVDPDEPARPPLDGGARSQRPTPHRRPAVLAPDEQPTLLSAPGSAANGDTPMAYGYRCARDHLNDPRNHFCTVCGIRMNERTGVIEVGVRPPLGLLVFDDGSTYTVDTDYLLGRMPETDPRVVGGQLRPLPVDDPDAQLSRGHLVIRVDGWDVTATDESRNGTLVARSPEEAWSRLTPRHPLRLLPGTRVRVGGRSFVFESPSGVR